VTVVVGPAGSGKTERLLGAYRAALAAGRAAGSLEVGLWIAPSRRAIDDVRTRLPTAEFRACFAPNVLTFEHLADRILDHADDEIRPIDLRMKRQLLERLIREAHGAKRLQHFAAVAETPGFVDLAAGFIADLKRAEVWPEEFDDACRKRSGGGKRPVLDRELHQLYAAYQDLLVRHRLYDAEGRLWAARDRLQRGQSRPLERLRFVVVDGFSDLSRTQQEIADLLAARVDEVYVSITDDADDERAELFRRPRKTLTTLLERHPQAQVERLAPGSRRPAALAHVERQLFKSPRHVTRGDDAAGIEILAASGRMDEIETLARRIKTLLKEGDGGRSVRPDDVAVVFRSLDDAAPLVREVFPRFGIPFALEAGVKLDQSPSLMALAALVDLDAEDWPYRKLLAVTGSNFFRPSWPERNEPGVEEAIEATIRSLQLPAGRTTLLDAIERLATSAKREVVAGSAEADSAARHNRRRRQARLAWPVLRRLAEAFDRLPRRADARGWSQALHELADDTGLAHNLHGAELAAWTKLHDALAASDVLSALVAEPAEEFDRARLRQLLDDVIRTEQLPGDHDEAGRVRVLSAVTARNLSIPFVFLAGLTEKSFPSPGRDDALYGDAERQLLIDQGLKLPSAADRFADEMLLFYEAATRADRRLWLSFAALNEKAEPLLPSPYLVELQDCFAPGVLVVPEVSELAAVSQAGAIVSLGEHRVRAVERAMQDDVIELATVARRRHTADANLLHGLAVVYERGAPSFGPYEGILENERAVRRVARRYDADHDWSADQLERYAECPFQFYLARVLGLRGLDEIALEIDHRRRGSRMHQVLAELHSRVNKQFGRAASPVELPAGELATLVEGLIDGATSDGDDPVDRALVEVDRRLLKRWLEGYVEQNEKYEAKHGGDGRPARPTFFEVSFGLAAFVDDGLSRREPLIVRHESESIRVTGRIDRIDVGDASGHAVFCVIDYKASKRQAHGKKRFLEGEALQLPLYSIAAQELLSGTSLAVPWRTGYWVPGDGGFGELLRFHEIGDDGPVETDDWKDLRDRIIRRVFELVRGIRRGEFPMFNRDEDCTSRCDFRTVCRVHQTRALGKPWPST
jgi:ATP-dependent helicase/DNAse subunit B